jgi:protease-4
VSVMLQTVRQQIVFLVLAAVVGLVAFAVGLWWFGRWHDEWSGYHASNMIADGYCNIAVIPVEGEIGFFGNETEQGSQVADADDIVSTIHQAESEPGIRGILVRIDSPGGTPVAARVIADALKRSSLPVVALIREKGTSAGYVLATGARIIIADPMSDVGSIGVTESYVDNVEKNRRDGLSFVSLASARYKDTGDPNKPLTKEERALLERDLKIVHDQLVKVVAENRKLPLDDVAKLADGSSMPGTLALESKLIDALGDQETARLWLAKQLGFATAELRYCRVVTIDHVAHRKHRPEKAAK